MVLFRSKKYQEKFKQNLIPELNTQEYLTEGSKGLRLLTPGDDEELYFKAWESLDESGKKRLSLSLWSNRLDVLFAAYGRSSREGQIKILETLGFIQKKEAVDFLVEALKSPDEMIRIACAKALRRQEPTLILEPMVEALAKPEVFLAARVYDVLSEIGVLLVPLILQKLTSTNSEGKTVMIQLLAAFGDESVAENIYAAAEGESYPVRKAACEAYGKLGGQMCGEYLSQALKDSDWQIRLLAVQGLKKLRYRQALPQLEAAGKKENDPQVKILIAALLKQWQNGEIISMQQWKRA